MQDMEYISSAGLRIFLGILQNAEEKGGHVYIKGLNDTVQATFDLTGFSNIFEFKQIRNMFEFKQKKNPQKFLQTFRGLLPF